MAAVATDRQVRDWFSDQLTRLIQLVFAVVLAQGLSRYSDVLVSPIARQNLVASLALVSVYLTAVQSWIGWHYSVVSSQYRLRHEDGSENHWERWRLYTDLAIVITYAYMLFQVRPLVGDGSADLVYLLGAYPVVFALYWFSGHARTKTYGSDASRPTTIVGSGVVFALLAVAYVIDRDSVRHSWLPWLNGAALGLAILMTILYRRWSEEAGYRRRLRRLDVAVDLDGVLGNQIEGLLPRIMERHNVELTYDDIIEWNLQIGQSDFKAEIALAFDDPEYVLSMALHDGATEALSQMASAGHRVFVLTARPDHVVELTERWVAERRLPVDSVVNAREAMKSGHGAEVLIDDFPPNLRDFVENTEGGFGVLRSQPWNSAADTELADLIEADRVFVVSSLGEAAAVVRVIARWRERSRPRWLVGRFLRRRESLGSSVARALNNAHAISAP